MSRRPSPPRPWTRAERLLAAAVLACLLLTGAGLAVMHREMVARRAAVEDRLRRHAIVTAARVTGDFHDAMEVLRNAVRRGAARAAAAPGQLSPAELLEPDRWAVEPQWPYGITLGPIFEVRGGEVTTLSSGRPAGDEIVASIADPHQPGLRLYRDRIVARGADTILLVLDSLPDGRWHGAELPLAEVREKLWVPRLRAVEIGSRWAAPDSTLFAPTDTLLAYAIVWGPAGTLLATYGDTAGTSHRASVRMVELDDLRLTLTLLPPMERLLLPEGRPPAPAARLAVLGGAALLVIAVSAWLAWRALMLSRAREAFAASVSHELRTPLTGITLFAETLLLDRITAPDARRRALQTIAGEAQRLSALVENVLTMARRGQPGERLQARATSLGDLLRAVEDAFAPMTSNRGVAFQVRVAGEDTAAIDPDAARRILVNLVDNALRHAAEATTLVVEAIHDDRGVTLVVADDGVGVDPRDARRIWTAWEHGPGGGSGLGLAVVARLARLHGGAARLAPSARGARFEVTLLTGTPA